MTEDGNGRDQHLLQAQPGAAPANHLTEDGTFASLYLSHLHQRAVFSGSISMCIISDPAFGEKFHGLATSSLFFSLHLDKAEFIYIFI